MKGHPDNLSAADSSPDQSAPGLGGIRFGPRFAALLYVMLASSAALSLLATHAPGALPQKLESIAPLAFVAFLVVFSLYRLRLVRDRKYPAFKALFQIGAGIIFLTLLLPAAKTRYEGKGEDLEALLLDGNPNVRALAAELARYRPEGSKYGAALVKALGDPDPRVREQAHRSLVRLAGRDLGSPDDEQAIKAWSARFP